MTWVSLFQLQRLGHLLRVGGSSTTEMHGQVMQLVARAAIRVFCCTWNYLKSVEFRHLTKFIDIYSLMMPCAGTRVEIIGLIRFLSGCCKR